MTIPTFSGKYEERLCVFFKIERRGPSPLYDGGTGVWCPEEAVEKIKSKTSEMQQNVYKGIVGVFHGPFHVDLTYFPGEPPPSAFPGDGAVLAKANALPRAIPFGSPACYISDLFHMIK